MGQVNKRFWQKLGRTKALLLPQIFGFVDGLRHTPHGTPDFASSLKSLDLVEFNISGYEDLIEGGYEGIPFALCEAYLGTRRSRRGTSSDVQFRGLVLKVKLEIPFPGWLVARKKRSGGLIGLLENGFSAADSKDLIALSADDVRELRQAHGAILSGHAALDESHEFVTDNLAAAATVMDQVAKTIAFLSTSFDEDIVRLALDGDSCILMLPSKHDFFELPNIYLEMTEAKIMPMLQDFVTLLEIAKLVSRIGAMEECAAAGQ